MEIEKKWLVLFGAIILLVALLAYVAAQSYTSWIQRMQWTVQNASFSVLDENGDHWISPYILTGVSGTRDYYFIIRNEGNVPITVVKSDVVAITGGIAVWNTTQLSNIPVDTEATFLLQITFSGDGSYEFRFDSQ